MLGATLAAQKKFSDAEPLLLYSYEQMRSVTRRLPLFFQPPDFDSEEEPGERILKLYEDWGKPEKVAEWKLRLQAQKGTVPPIPVAEPLEAGRVRWQTLGVPQEPWNFDLKMDGTTLTGTVSMFPGRSAEIYEGRVDGASITFKVTSPDGDRVITFTGKISGSEISFTRVVQVRAGGNPGGVGVFSGSAVAPFIAKRVP